ncbi:cell division protein ZapA [Staphylococcus pseudintermedius]|uniref:cell division protein ZapA n=1 Tax=Staphylococcus pseudintermedius TaxID=283734 RepID=UPI00103607AC|nr:cell division protein ZapA [Staphylococcus pseudintermedius]EGQ0356502.1 cell division protein ZapA [Staphylococcus pseudintermedius]EGQ0376179.1 cell division protein ZapA [Staphylococcus pseudintermedius]EGQ2758046.1 cell division protein ZapA [Staphylococcus pseudintermedius]EGQ2775226.1 cell division protein ZapA [Staphylococcus pseudintermedius]EGQ2861565.1 cell division protein ZapA [Staphylococcus pseudintermedius]
MAEFKNRINVTINDQNYTILGEDDPERIRYVADLVDGKIRELGRRNAGLDSVRKAVLTAVNVMHELVLLEEENALLREEIQRLKHRGL